MAIEDEKKFLLEQLGADAIAALEGIGLNVDEAVTSVLLDKYAGQAELSRKDRLLDLKKLAIEDLLTSELCYLSGLPGANPAYREELERRLALLGLTPEQAQEFTLIDQEALERKDPHQRAEGVGVSIYVFGDTTMESLPSPDQCLTSELVAIIDDAGAAIARDHTWLPPEAYAAAAYASGSFTGQSPYNDELVARFSRMGLGEDKFGPFIRDECLILGREKWGDEPEQMSWDPANFPNS